MRLTINQNNAIGETEIIINCTELDSRIRSLADYILQYSVTLEGELEGAVYYVPLETVLYIDSVDKRTFFYDRHRIFHSRYTLAELEEKLANRQFCRISKNCIVNLALVQCTRPLGNHRLELTMADGEHLLVGRTYQKQFRQRLKEFHMERGGKMGTDAVALDIPLPPAYSKERSILNAGEVLCFPETPGRVAALSFGMAELVCALGAEERLAVIAPAEDSLGHTLPQYRERLAKVPLLQHCGDGVPTEGELMALEVDLVLCSWYFPHMHPFGKRDTVGYRMYIAESTVPEKAGMEQLYRDILNLGRIFRAEDRAIVLVERIRQRISALRRRISRRPPVRVFVYDGRESQPLTAGKGTLEHDLITLAGGENVFGSIEGSYHTVTWQQVADAAPEVIVLHDYQDSMESEEKILYLKSRPELQAVPAIRQGRFVVLTLLEIFPGVQNAAAVEKLIRCFHPEAL